MLKNVPNQDQNTMYFIVKYKYYSIELCTDFQAFVIQAEWANPDNTFIIYRSYAQFFDLQV